MHTDFLRKTKKNALLLLLASAMALSGCGNGADASEDITVAESGSASEETAISEDNSAAEETLDNAEAVTIGGESFSIDTDIVTLKGDFYNDPISLSELSELTKMKELNILNYNEGGAAANIDFSELENLNIESITLNGVKFSDDDTLGFDNLKKIKNLKKISFVNCWEVNSWEFLNEFTSIESISFEVCNINNADFINHMSSLETVELNHTEIRSFDNLQDNTSVKYLNCTENKIEDIRGLKHLTELKSLFISEAYYNDRNDEFLQQYQELTQSLPNCDIEYIIMSNEGSVSAETVTIAGKEFPIDSKNIEILLTNDSEPITDISKIKNLKNLTSLTVRNISDGGSRAVDGLSELAGSETITNVSITASLAEPSDINVLETLPNLKSLTLYGINNYEDFGFDLPSLEYLYLAETFDLSRIKHLTNLKELGLEYNFSDDLSPVADLTNLKSLSITECGFSDYSCILKLNNPDKLFISSEPMSENMYDQIAEKFPDCEITIVNDFVD